jgi:hypothetical protein
VEGSGTERSSGSGATVAAGVAPFESGTCAGVTSSDLGELEVADADCGGVRVRAGDLGAEVAGTDAGLSRCSMAWKVPTCSARPELKSPLENANAVLALRRRAEMAPATKTVRVRLMSATIRIAT